MLNGNPQTALSEARELTAGEILANTVRAIEFLHERAKIAADLRKEEQALRAYELAYNLAHEVGYTGSKHVATCAFLFWYRNPYNPIGAQQALAEAQSIAKTEIDFRTSELVLRLMKKRSPVYACKP